MKNWLMEGLQSIVAFLLVALFVLMAIGPMLGLPTADPDMKETEKNLMFILAGFLFGSSVAPKPPAPPGDSTGGKP